MTQLEILAAALAWHNFIADEIDNAAEREELKRLIKEEEENGSREKDIQH